MFDVTAICPSFLFIYYFCLQKTEPALNLGPQPTPELEAIAREVDALARERLALEAEVATKQRELTVKSGEADSLQVRGISLLYSMV